MDGKRPVVVWLTEEDLRQADAYPRDLSTATREAFVSACRAALDGEGPRAWWANYDMDDPEAPPDLSRFESNAKALHDAEPRFYGPPVKVVVVEVKK